MSDSILNSTKKVLGIEPDYMVFDIDVMMHINSVFTTLAQLGIGPVNGFMIRDSIATWDDILGEDLNLNSVKTYVYLRVRLLFDPPSTPHAINAMKEQITELEWRLNTQREATSWVTPEIPIDTEVYEVTVIDGGIG